MFFIFSKYGVILKASERRKILNFLPFLSVCITVGLVNEFYKTKPIRVVHSQLLVRDPNWKKKLYVTSATQHPTCDTAHTHDVCPLAPPLEMPKQCCVIEPTSRVWSLATISWQKDLFRFTVPNNSFRSQRIKISFHLFNLLSTSKIIAFMRASTMFPTK